LSIKGCLQQAAFFVIIATHKKHFEAILPSIHFNWLNLFGVVVIGIHSREIWVEVSRAIGLFHNSLFTGREFITALLTSYQIQTIAHIR